MRTLSVSAFAGLLVLLTIATALADLPPGGSFADDNGNVHEGYIEAIAEAGITKGCNPPLNTEYCPSNPVTRGQMAAFLVRALGLTDDGGSDQFGDDDGSVFESDINKLATAGITKGCNPPTNDQFCPDSRVTREQMAAFLVRAYGYSGGTTDYFGDDAGSIFQSDINHLAAAGITRGCNPPTNDSYCPTQSVRRDEMASFLGRAEGLTPMVPPPPNSPQIETIASNFDFPVLATSPTGDGRLFVVEKGGYIRIVQNDVRLSGAFLNISSLVSEASEQGLLGLAFHPQFATNDTFYVSYTNDSGDTRIVEYQVSADPNVADATSARPILSVDQPFTNHNGGMIMFDPDGYLLVGLGDGGSGGDPLNHGENTATLLGAMLRIDVDGDDFLSDANRNYAIPADNPFVGSAGADEIWAYGLRNPWRFSIDSDTGLLYIGDVGQGLYEEIDVAPADTAGLNYGWNSYEANHCYDTGDGCNTAGKEFPAFSYGRSDGCSVTGGIVYRGSDFPELDGHYFFADYCRGELRSFYYDNGNVLASKNWASEFGGLGSITSFGLDSEDRLYILNSSGDLMRLAPTS